MTEFVTDPIPDRQTSRPLCSREGTQDQNRHRSVISRIRGRLTLKRTLAVDHTWPNLAPSLCGCKFANPMSPTIPCFCKEGNSTSKPGSPATLRAGWGLTVELSSSQSCVPQAQVPRCDFQSRKRRSRSHGFRSAGGGRGGVSNLSPNTHKSRDVGKEVLPPRR